MRSHFFSYHIGTLVAPIIFGLSLALLTMVLNANHYVIALGNPAQVTSVTASIPPRMFAVFAAGDINNPIDNLSITGGGQGIIIKDGSLYSGGDTHLNNTLVTGGSSTITSVGTCGPTNQCLGTGVPVVNGAAPLPLPQFFDINDFLPGRAVEAAVGSGNYHYIDGDMTSFASVADGVYYVTGNVKMSGGTGTHRVTIVSQGNQQYSSSVNLYAYFHNLLFFSNSTNESNGAIELSASNVTWQGLMYAPNGDMNMSAASNDQIYGAMYAQHVVISGSAVTITCPFCNPLSKSVIPTNGLLYDGVVTYSIVLRNTNLVSDTHMLFTDTLPAGVTFGQWLDQPISGTTQNDNTITWTDTLAPATSIAFTFTATNTNSPGNVVTNIGYFSDTWGAGNADAAFFVLPFSYTLVVNTAGDGTGVVTPTTGVYSYPYNSFVTASASANAGSIFAGWSGDCSGIYSNNCNTTMTSNKSITATFALNAYTLTVATAGNGTGLVTPTAGVHTYSYNSYEQVMASANAGSAFVGWSGDCFGMYACGFNMTSDKNVTATFALIVPYSLTVATTGNGTGVVTPTVGTYLFTSGTVITLEAKPNFGSTFTGWSGDAGCAAGSVTMYADKACIATFITHHSYLPIIFK